MKKNSQKEAKKSKLKPMIVLIAFTAIMLIISTYAWFSTQRAVTLTNLSGKVNVAEGLEISLDALNWAYEIDLSNASLTELTTAERMGTYSTTANHVPTELIPASTIGATGGTVVKLWTGVFDGTKLSGIGQCDESVTLASQGNYAGYYAFDVFLRNSSAGTADQALSISKGSSLTVLPAGEDGTGGDETTGLQNTVRLAFAKYNATADVRASKDTIIANTVTANPTISQVAIWEPNANYHVDYMVTNAQRYSFDNPSRNKLMTTYALNDTSVDEIANVYDTSEATMSSKLSQQKVVQTSITVPTTDTDNDGTLDLPSDYTTPEAVALTDTSATPAAFTLAANTVTRVRIYVWLEGQDVDCINYASHGGGIVCNFGLEKQ